MFCAESYNAWLNWSADSVVLDKCTFRACSHIMCVHSVYVIELCIGMYICATAMKAAALFCLSSEYRVFF